MILWCIHIICTNNYGSYQKCVIQCAFFRYGNSLYCLFLPHSICKWLQIEQNAFTQSLSKSTPPSVCNTFYRVTQWVCLCLEGVVSFSQCSLSPICTWKGPSVITMWNSIIHKQESVNKKKKQVHYKCTANAKPHVRKFIYIFLLDYLKIFCISLKISYHFDGLSLMLVWWKHKYSTIHLTGHHLLLWYCCGCSDIWFLNLMFIH